MSLNTSLIGEIRHEGTLTKKVLDRIPFDRADWKPHEKSMSVGQLANHLADLLRWVPLILDNEQFDIVTQRLERGAATDTAGLLAGFETNWNKAIEALEKATDEQLDAMWTLSRGGNVMFTIPKKVAIRSMALSHQYHHRGQLTVYLRMLDIPVPSIYGPSADESN